jgi:hypothetical protein
MTINFNLRDLSGAECGLKAALMECKAEGDLIIKENGCRPDSRLDALTNFQVVSQAVIITKED